MKTKTEIALALGVACSLLVLLLFWVGAFEFLELKSVDLRFRFFSEQEQASPPEHFVHRRASKDVVLVTIDENSLKELKQQRITWKWPRDLYAALVNYLHRGGARLVLFDVLFSEPDIDRLNTDAEQTDGALATAMQKAGNVILAAQLREEENFLVDDNSLSRPPKVTLSADARDYPFETYTNIIVPITLFQESALTLGAANYRDDADGIFRRVHLLYQYLDAVFPQLGLAAYMASHNIQQIDWDARTGLKLGDLQIPLDGNGRYVVNWYGKGGPEGPFKYYSFAALLSSAVDEQRGATPLVPSGEFRDKLVIVGSNAAGLFDLKKTPLSTDAVFPGMEIHATILSNLLQRDFLNQAPNYVTVLAILFFSFVIPFGFALFRSVGWIVLVVVLCVIGWTYGAVYAFQTHRLLIDVVTPQVAILAAFTISAVASYQTEGKARRQLRSMFERYVSPAVIKELVDKQEGLELGGQEVVCTVLFSDIKDFTSMSERLTPKELVQFLNSYFTIETEVILANGGLLDKYLGDAVMAVFGAPIPTTNHAVQACSAALDVQRALKQFELRHDGTTHRTETRIGISTGPMVVGNIGSPHRLDYTAIGDTVNLASRLEGVNKLFGTSIILTEETKSQLDDLFLVRPLDDLRVKGKEKAVRVYELMEKRETVSQTVLQLVSAFSEALELYRTRRFDQALRSFQAIPRDHPNDGPTQVYIGRCEAYAKNPPPSEWDGVYIMLDK